MKKNLLTVILLSALMCLNMNTLLAQTQCTGLVEGPASATFCLGASAASDIAATSLPTSDDTGFENYTLVVTSLDDVDPEGLPKILDITGTGEFDFGMSPAGTYGFTGFGYNQTQVDAVATFLNANPALATVIGLPAEALPLPVPLPLEELLNIAKLFSPEGLTISGVQSALALLAPLGIPVDYCLLNYDEMTAVATPSYTVMVTDDATACAAAGPSNNECMGGMTQMLFAPGAGASANYGPYDNTEATTEASDPELPACFPDNSMDNTLWFDFMGDGNPYHIYTTRNCGGIELGDEYIDFGDTQMAIFTGDCGDLVYAPTFVGADACNEDDSSAPGYNGSDNYVAGITIPTEVGTVYHIMIDGYNDGGTPSLGSYCINFDAVEVQECTANLEWSADQPLEIVSCPTGGATAFAIDQGTFDAGYEAAECAEVRIVYALSTEAPRDGFNPTGEAGYLGFTANAIPTGNGEGLDPFGIGVSEFWVSALISCYDSVEDSYSFPGTCTAFTPAAYLDFLAFDETADCVAPDCGEANVALAADQALSATICPGDSVVLAADPNTLVAGPYGDENSVIAWVVTDTDPAGTNPLDIEGRGIGIGNTLTLSNADTSRVRYCTAIIIHNYDAVNGTGSFDDCETVSETVVVTYLDSSDPACAPAPECTATAATINADGATEVTICAGDDLADVIAVTVEGGTGLNATFVITDEAGDILGLPPTAADLPDFDEAVPGNCSIWYLTWDGTISGANIGDNASGLATTEPDACFFLSNPIVVTRQESGVDCNVATCELEDAVVSIVLSDGVSTETTICAGDGIADPIDVLIAANPGASNSVWLITDTTGIVLGLPTAPPFDLEGAGAGLCLIWYVIYEDEIEGLAVGANAFDIDLGCAAIADPILVNRLSGADCPGFCAANGGELSTDDATTVCVGDGVQDPVTVAVTGVQGDNYGYFVADENGDIISPAITTDTTFDFEGADGGVCLIYGIAYGDDLTGFASEGNIADLAGCFALSTPIEVTRLTEGELCAPPPATCAAAEITLASGATSTSICAGDGVADPLDVTVTGGEGSTAWAITDPDGNILGLPAGPPFDLDGAGEGNCLIWQLNYSGDLEGAAVGANAGDVSSTEGCLFLSNPISVERYAPLNVDYSVNCNSGAAAFIVDVTITGGSGSYTVTGDLSTSEAIFQLGPLSDGESFTVIVNDGVCQEVIISEGPIACTKCDNSAGTIDGELIVSTTGTATVTTEGENLCSDDDVLVYILTDANGEVVATSPDGTFDLGGDILAGVTYTVTAVVGLDGDGDGMPDDGEPTVSSNAGSIIFIGDIVITTELDCSPEGILTVTFVINGGLPDVDGSSYTVSGNFEGTLTAGEEASFSLQQEGTSWSISVTDDAGATASRSGTSNCIKGDVELLSFSGEVLVEGNFVKWQTATETNNDFFSLERSNDGINFETIATITGAGTTLEPQQYNFMDKTPFSGASYYRLTQTDFDGSTTQSDVITLTRGETNFGFSSITPMPVTHVVNVFFNTNIQATVDVELFDITGRMLQSQSINAKAGTNNADIDMNNYSTGIYFVTINNGQTSVTQKIVKK